MWMYLLRVKGSMKLERMQEKERERERYVHRSNNEIQAQRCILQIGYL